MENTRQPIPLRIRQHLRDAVGRMHPSVSFVSCIGVLLAYLTGVYITGSLHEASRWMGAMLACTSLVVVLQSHNYKDSLRAGWTRVLGTFLGALVAYIYLKIWPFSIVGMLASVFVLEMLCMLVGIYQNNRIATITLLIILLVSQMTPHVSPAVNCLLRFTESVVGVGVGVALLWVLERWKRWLEPQEGADTSTDKNMNMDTMPLRWGHFRVLIVASLGQITGAGLATLVGVILPMIQIFRHPGLTSLQQGLVAATSLVGIMVGSVLFGAWSDKKGYLFFFRFCPALILAASLFTFFTADLFGLVTGLFFMGLGIGGGYSLDSDYISEIMPRRWKLLMVGVAKAASSLGSIAAAAICFSLLREWHDPHLWNRLLLLVAVMAVVMLLCRIRFEQSPGWLIAHGRISEAEKAVRYFLGPNVEIGEIRNRPNKTQMPKVAWSDLFKPGQVKKVIFSGIPWACEGLGVYGIGVFLPVLVMALGLETGSESAFSRITDSVLLTTWINLCILPGFVLGLLLVNRWYHVRTQTWGFILCAAGMGILLAAYEFHWPVWIAVSGFMLFELFLNAGPHLMTFIIPPQIYSVAERGAGAGLAAAFGKLGAVAGVVVIPILLKWGGASLVLWVTIGVLLAGALVTAVVGREVLPDKGRSVRPEIRRD